MTPAATRFLAGWLFFASGAAGLVYQVLWTREVTLLVGGTTIATGLVLAIFLGGLGFGAWIGGRWTSRHADGGLRAYALLELLIGLCGLAALPALRSLGGPLGVIWRACWPNLTAAAVAQSVVVGAVLFVPTSLMGATLPILCQAFITRRDEIAAQTGRLYGLNTLGAACGAFAAAFLLVPSCGMALSGMIAATINIAVAAGAWGLARAATRGEEMPRAVTLPAGGREKAEATETTETTETTEKTTTRPDGRTTNGPSPAGERETPPGTETEDGPAAPPRVRVAAVLIFGISGFCALLYEVAWTRTLSLTVGSSTYALGTMLAVFIFGLGLGGLVGGRASARRGASLLTLGWLQAGIGFAVLIGIPLLGRLPVFLLGLPPWLGRQFGAWSVVILASAAAIMLVPAFLSGMMFPVLNALAVQDPRGVGRWIGVAYAMNTIGSVAGSLAGAFLLLPQLGLQWTLGAAAAVQVTTAAATIGAGRGRADGARRRWTSSPITATAVAALGAIALSLFPPWDPAIVSSGIFLSPYWLEEKTPEGGAPDVGKALQRGFGTVLYHAEGAHGAVIVSELSSGSRVLHINGKPDASSESGDMPTQVMLGAAPLLLRPVPRSVFILGLGSGVTAGVVARCDPPPRVLIAEFVPEVIEASRFFDNANFGLHRCPGVQMLPVDGRAFLQYSEERFDLIISEPSNPWKAGMAHCFTDEFFRIARDRLRPGGLFVQWVQGYGLGAPEFNLLIGTLSDTFPHIAVWEGLPGMDYILIASLDPLPVKWADAKRWIDTPHMSEVAKRLGLPDARSLLGFYVGGPDTVRALPAPAERHTDDRMQMEMRMARLLNRPSLWDDLAPLLTGLCGSPEALYTNLPPEEAAWLRPLPQMRIEMYEARTALNGRRHDEAITHFERGWSLFRHGPMGAQAAPVLMMRAKARLRGGDPNGALADLAVAHDMSPGREDITLWFAETAYSIGKAAEAIPVLEHAVGAGGSNHLRVLLGICYEEEHQWDNARSAFASAIGKEPSNPGALAGLGRICLAEHRPDEAVEAFTRAVKAAPDDPSILRDRARAFRALTPPREEEASKDEAGAARLEAAAKRK